MKLTASVLFDLLEEVAPTGSRIKTDYSGRGMYGKTCIGISLHQTSDLFILGYELAQAAVDCYGEDKLEEIYKPNIDSLGTGVVAYWPKFSLEKGEESV